ncbi:MAG: hypothetical protein IJT59_00410 [Desulfovibrionaceae bacterium]|nr:hypothetical protein [Desulfovibrionaceae bacterium]
MESMITELFGHLVYADSLTYDELLDTEEQLIEDLERILEQAEAEHMEFNPLGDALMFQCEFTHHKLYIFRKLACDLVQILPQGIDGRMFFLSHDLAGSTLYWVKPHEWQEENLALPLTAPSTAKSWSATKE